MKVSLSECQKRQLTKREAQEALNWIEKNKGKKQMRGRKEVRFYHCPDCNTYHLTSK